jgi:hypothetical protein
MDQLRVHKLKQRFPAEVAQLKGTIEELDTPQILALLDLDSTLGFAATEYLETMSGEDPKEIFYCLMGVIHKFSSRVEEMFPGLSESEKEQIKQIIRSKSS